MRIMPNFAYNVKRKRKQLDKLSFILAISKRDFKEGYAIHFTKGRNTHEFITSYNFYITSIRITSDIIYQTPRTR